MTVSLLVCISFIHFQLNYGLSGNVSINLLCESPVNLKKINKHVKKHLHYQVNNGDAIYFKLKAYLYYPVFNLILCIKSFMGKNTFRVYPAQTAFIYFQSLSLFHCAPEFMFSLGSPLHAQPYHHSEQFGIITYLPHLIARSWLRIIDQ